jgi:hypothetical protein
MWIVINWLFHVYVGVDHTLIKYVQGWDVFIIDFMGVMNLVEP